MLAFLALGLIFGIIYDIAALIESVFSSKSVTFVVDFLMMVIWGVLFVCTLIAFNNGQMRFFFILITAFSYVIYLISVHKIISTVLGAIFYPLKKLLKFISKKLKIDKKV